MSSQLLKFALAFIGVCSVSTYLCVDNACDCRVDDLLDCQNMLDVSLLNDLSTTLKTRYTRIMLHPDATCRDASFVEVTTGMEVININCRGGGDVNMKHVKNGLDTHDWINIVIQIAEIMMILVSLFIAGKNRHNLLPFIKQLPTLYTSNKTFVKHLFTRKPQYPNITIMLTENDGEDVYLGEGGIPLSTIATSTPRPQLQTPRDFGGPEAAGGVQALCLTTQIPGYVLYIINYFKINSLLR